MVKSLAFQNAKTWRDAARESNKSREIFYALRSEFQNNVAFQTMVRNNAHFISSVPNDIAKHLTEHVASEAIAGVRAESLLQSIRAIAPHLTKTRAQLIARTETAKSQAAIVEVRATQIGIDWYQWDTSNDQRVRESHKHMDGVYCQFSSPPSPEQLSGEPSVGYYNPGNIWNCRCSAFPVVDWDLVQFPIKIVRNNRIVRMTKADFLRIQ
jgi:SPP1 gp7 family putative phage head morphogenesis protein